MKKNVFTISTLFGIKKNKQVFALIYDPSKPYFNFKKYLITVLLFCLLPYLIFSQSTIKLILQRDHRTNQSRQIFRIQKLRQELQDGKCELALKQLDIIGNNYYRDERIGSAHNENSYGTSTDYVPIDGYKRTFCGTAHENYFREPGSLGSDDDLNTFIKVSPTNTLLNLNKDILRQRLGSDFDVKWNLINGEIDVPDVFHPDYINNAPVSGDGQLPDQVCLYGAWVGEVEGVIGGHGNYNEIHPSEQSWFQPRKNLQIDAKSYTLNLAVDNSGRFNRYSEYESGRPDKLWSKSPLDGVFAIAFETKLSRKERINFSVDSLSAQYVHCLKTDGKKHYLVYERDTLIEVNENTISELVNISFDRIGYKLSRGAGSRVDTIVTGFLLLTSRIATAPFGPPVQPYGGHLLMNVFKKTISPIRQQVKISVTKIRRLFNNSYVGINPFTNKMVSRFHPLPVPETFNETQVSLELRVQHETRVMPAVSLEPGQELAITDCTLFWEDFISNNFRGRIICKSKYGVNDFPLGEMEIGGDPLRADLVSGRTRFPFELGDERLEAILFEITLKIEPISRAEPGINSH